MALTVVSVVLLQGCGIAEGEYVILGRVSDQRQTALLERAVSTRTVPTDPERIDGQRKD